MIDGIQTASNLFSMLGDLALMGDRNYDIDAIPNYTVKYGANSVMWHQGQEQLIDDEFGSPTDEEADIIFICEHGVDAWIDKIDSMLLGDEDE